MNTQLRVAIVTGASGGIGRAVTRRLAADGFTTVVSYSGNSADAEKTVADIEAAGGSALAHRADVAAEREVAGLFDKTLQTFGRLDAVVNAAGIMPLFPIAKPDLEAFDRAVAINLRGAFVVLSQAAQHVANGGRIVAFSSSVIGLALPNYGPYIATKAAVEGLVRVLANELRGRSISVNAVAPGPIPTDLFLKGKTDAQIEWFRKQPPLERLGHTDDVAGAASFLCGPEGAWVNGQILRVNGGLV
jgi:3-oxoacyl-[acyl-carrier protein] reductase